MLTLKRRINQTILIGPDIVLRVTSLSPYAVDLTIEAPNRTLLEPPGYARSCGPGRKTVKIRCRKLEELTINDIIDVSVYEVTKTVVCLGITAPESIRIDRGDRAVKPVVHEEIGAQKGEAA